MGPQPHTYGRGRFFRGRARGPFFAAGRYNGPGGPLLQVPGRSPSGERARRGPRNRGAAPHLRPHAWRRRARSICLGLGPQ
eukprot:gene21165-biopygen22161